MKYKIDRSVSSSLGICKDCGARFLGVSIQRVKERMAEHERIVHPEGTEMRSLVNRDAVKERARKKTAKTKASKKPVTDDIPF